MADITAKKSTRAANALTMTAASSGGDSFVNTGNEMVLIANDSGGPITLTIETTLKVDGEDVADKEISIADGEMHLLGPFSPGWYNDDDGKVNLSYSSETSVTLAVIQRGSLQ